MHADVLQRAETLSGPLIGLYGRAGVARLQSGGNPYLQCVGAFGVLCPLYRYPDQRFNRTSIDVHYGGGLQVKFSALVARLEYERISDSHGDPDLLSLGLVWTF